LEPDLVDDRNFALVVVSNNTMKSIVAWLRRELPQILLILLGVFVVRSSLADHYYVPSGSMEYTLLAGDRVIVSKLAYGLRIPFTSVELMDGRPVERGDIVIFDSPRDGTRLIKRIVGVGGDTITLTNGRLFVDGNPLASDTGVVEVFGEHIAALNLEDGGGPELANSVVPDGMLLAIGDHRGRSMDGRYFGLIPESMVYGKALGIYRRKDEGFVWRPL
jgi:signal peptidase I